MCDNDIFSVLVHSCFNIVLLVLRSWSPWKQYRHTYLCLSIFFCSLFANFTDFQYFALHWNILNCSNAHCSSLFTNTDKGKLLGLMWLIPFYRVSFKQKYLQKISLFGKEGVCFHFKKVSRFLILNHSIYI